MTPHDRDLRSEEPASASSSFKYLVGGSALFIAICSAGFSVRGLGLLFVGSAVAVMIMAASLEVGKLVAASFLYRYWDSINRPLKIYLLIAVIALIAITSLGNYGYLARAYERTHTQITMFDSQIASMEKEIAETQKEIEASRGQLSKVSDIGRGDIGKLQQRIAQGTESLNLSLARIQERRKTAQDRRDRDTQAPTQRITEQGDVLKKAVAVEEAAIGGLNDRVAGLDRAVDAYTKMGGPGFFKVDSIKTGQELRDKQKAERDAISTELAEHRARIERLRNDQGKQLESAQRELAGVRDLSAQELARLDAEEQELRKSHATSMGAVEQQLAALMSQGQSSLTVGDTQVESLYQRIRSRNEEIHQLRNKIASVDIGSYRFIARAFEAAADDVVKWLMLALVLVFDPLAVSLFVGFNVALLRDPKRRRPTSPGLTEDNGDATVLTGAPRNRWSALGTSLLIAFGVGVVAFGSYLGYNAWHGKATTSHASLIPGDSFAVLTLRPHELRRSAGPKQSEEWLGSAAGKIVADATAELLQSGFDSGAEVYAFAKFPSKRPSEKSDRPVMLCGFVAKITDSRDAEAALSRLADKLGTSLRASTSASLTRSRSMIRFGLGRYMDPEGGFFTFGLTDHAAIMLIEFEGDPQSPCVENEMRLCLTEFDPAATASAPDAIAVLPARARKCEGPMAVWFNAERFFSLLPKNPAAQARYQQLERHLGFDLLLTIKPASGDQLNITADYAYQFDRFKNREKPRTLEFLASLGSPDGAGLGGRLMDRCMDTLDYDSLIERLRATLGATSKPGAEQVLVEKSFASDRDAQFVVSARYNPQAGAPLAAAVQTLFQ